MTLSTNDCKLFIAENAKDNNVPPNNWKRILKRKNIDGWIRTFEHKDGHIIEIIENTTSSSLKWVSTKISNNTKLSSSSKFTDDNFKELPNSVQLFINTLRSLQGSFPLKEKTFPHKYQKLWQNTIKDRQKKYDSSRTPNIWIFDSENSDELSEILQNNLDSSWNDENILKYSAKYFWFAFANDPREYNENPIILVTPKGFWDDERVPMIFNHYTVNHPLIEGLVSTAESMLEFEIDGEDPLEKILKTYQKMKEIGIDFSIELQENMHHDFVSIDWLNENTKQSIKSTNNNKLKTK